ncbi:MAG: Gfo/Idh/MocA family oxidoreductase [Verrucomicrobiota bacterium]
MNAHEIGVVMNGVTGRMGTNQHLVRSILAIREQGGVRLSPDETIMPVPILTGRNENKLRQLAERYRVEEWTTDVEGAVRSDDCQIFFDASGTLQRARFVEMAVKAGKAVYCEKPTAVEAKEALRLYRLCRDAGLKNGVVQDKLWLPGLRRLKTLMDQGFFGRILSVRGDFGYWVFTGHVDDQPAQRPSWNYRREEGGGIMVDMFCHWRYVLDNLFGPVKSVCGFGMTDIPERIGENGEPYNATADDSAYAMFELENGTLCQFNSSWCTRVRRDDLLTVQVDGTQGSAVAGLRECWIQPLGATPKPVWNPDLPQPIDFYEHWQQMPDACEYDNAFKAQWELFLRHVVKDEPFPWTLLEGAKGVQLAELGLQSWRERRWVEVEPLEP